MIFLFWYLFLWRKRGCTNACTCICMVARVVILYYRTTACRRRWQWTDICLCTYMYHCTFMNLDLQGLNIWDNGHSSDTWSKQCRNRRFNRFTSQWISSLRNDILIAAWHDVDFNLMSVNFLWHKKFESKGECMSCFVCVTRKHDTVIKIHIVIVDTFCTNDPSSFHLIWYFYNLTIK